MTELRLRCIETGKIWPKTYTSEAHAKSGRDRWNRLAEQQLADLQRYNPNIVETADRMRPVELIEVKVTTIRVIDS